MVLGCSDEDLLKVRVPTVIVPGNDATHPLWVAEHLAGLWPHATFHPPSWSAEEALANQSRRQEDVAEERAGRLTPLFLDFLARHSATPVAAG